VARVPDAKPPAFAADQAATRVRIFGGVLETDRSLPGLPVVPLMDDGQFPLWTLVTSDDHAAPSHSDGAAVTGRLTYSSGPVVTLADRGDAPEVVISDTGRFTMRTATRIIQHIAPPDVDRAAVALDLIGVVLPYALHRDGAWCMHASAVQVPAGVIAFIAPRGVGKSTLAAACTQAGCALVADDVVVMRAAPDGRLSVTPSGVPLRLREHTARAVGIETGSPDGWGKVRVPGALATLALPLAAVYVLSPAAADATCARVERSRRAAALALLTNGKITELLGGHAAGDALERCVSLAAMTHMYDLAVPRDLSRLPSVVQALLAWHDAPSPASNSA